MAELSIIRKLFNEVQKLSDQTVADAAVYLIAELHLRRKLKLFRQRMTNLIKEAKGDKNA